MSKRVANTKGHSRKSPARSKTKQSKYKAEARAKRARRRLFR
jgi:hypothetical protein